MKIRKSSVGLFAALAVVAAFLCWAYINLKQVNTWAIDVDEPQTVYKLDGAEQAARYFQENVTSLDKSRKCNCVSPVFATTIPSDIGKLNSESRKELFIVMMLPVIARENMRIQQERNRVIELVEKRKRYQKLYWQEKAFLRKKRAEYGVKSSNPEKLLKRIDVIPVSLALAQAIIESGWGTSRFALQGNSLYGVHWPRGSKKKYILSKIGKIKVAAYDSIGESTHHYLQLLNSASAYEGLRTRRLNLKRDNRTVSGAQLAGALTSYSEIGSNYVYALQRVIKAYKLEEYNTVQLQEGQTSVKLVFI